MANELVTIFDTTLRDGEQSPGASMNTYQKMEVARALKELGVDVIEAGFPVASPGDFEAVRMIAEQVRGPVICGLARCSKLDIERAGTAIKPAEHGRIHVFLATSAIHREFKLKMAKEEIIRRAVEGVEQARNFTDDVEFSPEDASRTELDFLCAVVEAAIKAGATTVNIPDTVGYSTPQEYSGIITHLRNNVSNIDRAVISVHCHNDLGLAVANSLAAVQAGARQVECTVNGIGERAGNAALEEVVMAIKVRRDLFANLETNINTKRIVPTSRLVSNTTGLHVQRNKAIVGQNAFAHESGIHQDGMLKDRRTYEIMMPEDIGLQKSELVLGKHSGRHALKSRIEELGYSVNDEQLSIVFADFKKLCDAKKEVFDTDIEALVDHSLQHKDQEWTLVSLHTSAGTACVPSATVMLRRNDGREVKTAEFGDGPIDAIFKAIAKLTEMEVPLTDFQVRSVSRGQDALGEVYVELQRHGKVFRGRAVATDIALASAEAFLSTINRIIATEFRDAPVVDDSKRDLVNAV